MAILQRLGGRTLAAAMPTEEEFEQRLTKDEALRRQTEARLRALEIDLDVQRRQRARKKRNS